MYVWEGACMCEGTCMSVRVCGCVHVLTRYFSVTFMLMTHFLWKDCVTIQLTSPRCPPLLKNSASPYSVDFSIPSGTTLEIGIKDTTIPSKSSGRNNVCIQQSASRIPTSVFSPCIQSCLLSPAVAGEKLKVQMT